jgi:hypothetical protein
MSTYFPHVLHSIFTEFADVGIGRGTLPNEFVGISCCDDREYGKGGDLRLSNDSPSDLNGLVVMAGGKADCCDRGST